MKLKHYLYSFLAIAVVHIGCDSASQSITILEDAQVSELEQEMVEPINDSQHHEKISRSCTTSGITHDHRL